MDATNALMQNMDDGTNELKSIGGQTRDLTDSIIGTMGRQQELTKNIATNEAKGEQAANTMGKDLGAAYGVDQNLASNRLTKLASIKTQASDAAMSLLDQANQMESTSFFSNPIAYITNNFAADGLKERAKLNQDRANIATSEMQTINDGIRSGAETARTMTKVITDEDTANKIELTSIAAKQAADKIKFDLLGKQTDSIKAIQAGDNMQLAAMHGQQTLAMDQQRLDMAHTEFDAGLDERAYQHQKDMTAEKWHIEDNKFREMVYEDKIAARDARLEMAKTKENLLLDKTETGKAARAAVVNNYRTVMAKLGAARTIALDENDPEIAYSQIVAYDKQPATSPLKQKMALLDSIVASSATNGGLVTLGNSPVESLKAVATLDPEMQYNQGKVHKAFLENALAEVQALPNYNSMSTIEKEAAINANAVGRWKAATKNPDTSSEYARLPRLTLMQGVGNVTKTAIWGKVLKPELDDGNVDITGESLLKMVDAYTQDNNVNINEAGKEAASIVVNSLKLNDLNNGQVQLGLPAQRDYNITMNVAGKLATFNLADPSDFTKALLARKVQFRSGLFDSNMLEPALFKFDQIMESGLDAIGADKLKQLHNRIIAGAKAGNNNEARSLFSDLLSGKDINNQQGKTALLPEETPASAVKASPVKATKKGDK